MPLQILKSVYYTLINPYFDYCNLIWGMGSSVKDLFIKQKRAVRIITCSQWTCHTSPLFKMLRILKLQELHKLHVACFMYKVHMGLLPCHFLDMFQTNTAIHSYNTRQADNYHVTFSRTNLMKSTIRIAGPLLWNSIDDSIKSAVSFCIFKTRYRNQLLNLQ
jgi:hypothetical protein